MEGPSRVVGNVAAACFNIKADGCGRVHNLDPAMSSSDNFRLVVLVVLVMLIVAGLGDLEVSSGLFRVGNE